MGAHCYSLLIGVAVQWLTGPAHVPSAAEIVRADRGVVAGLVVSTVDPSGRPVSPENRHR
ncbi:hypothetical protein ACWEOE_33265 [Amycolatopsis sp. NPDC004368]